MRAGLVVYLLFLHGVLSKECGDGKAMSDHCAHQYPKCPENYSASLHEGCYQCFHVDSCQQSVKITYLHNESIVGQDRHVDQDRHVEIQEQVLAQQIMNDKNAEAEQQNARGNMSIAIGIICAVFGLMFGAFVQYQKKNWNYSFVRTQNEVDENGNLNPFCNKLPLDDEKCTLKSPKSRSAIILM
jgi:hypothetical protein